MADSEKLQEIADLIHQLRQPLNIISLSCGNLQSRLKSRPEAFDSNYATDKMARVESSINKAKTIINQIELISKRSDIN